MLTLALPERVSPMETMTAGAPASSALFVRGVDMGFAADVGSNPAVEEGCLYVEG